MGAPSMLDLSRLISVCLLLLALPVAAAPDANRPASRLLSNPGERRDSATEAAPKPVAKRIDFVAADTWAKALELRTEPADYDKGSQDAFTQMEVDGRCSATKFRTSEVTLRWEVNRPEVEAYRIDISKFRDGFATGRYLTSGLRDAGERALLFDEASAGLYYYWRVLAKTPDGWVVSGNGRFDAPTCAVDMVKE
jgi:hypothetical protein